MVSKSRISPTRMTSGSCRSALRSACANERVSTDTSRWLTIDRLSRCRNSIGSSTVITCEQRELLTWSIIAASVVLLPLPVVPVTRTSPRSSSADFAEHRRQQQVVDRQDLRRDDAEHHAHRAALLEDVDAEAAEPGDAVREVDFLRLGELVALLGRHHGRAHRQRVFVHQPLFFVDGHERAGDARHRVRADFEVQVGRALGDSGTEEIVDIHREKGLRAQGEGLISPQPLLSALTYRLTRVSV